MAKHSDGMKQQSIEAYQVNARPGWRVDWYDRKGVRRTASCGTRDKSEAKAVALGLELLANDPSAYDAEPNNVRFESIHGRAKQIFWGLEVPPTPPPARMPIGEREIGERLAKTGKAGFSAPKGKRWTMVPNPEVDEERRKRIDAERKAATLEREKKSWEQERLEYVRRLNDHCDVTVDEAVAAFEVHYTPDHDSHTVGQVMRVNRELAEMIGGDARVGEVAGGWINDYIEGYGDGESGLATRRKVRAYISTFWTWAVKQYLLNGNPMDHVHSVSADSPENIRAFRDWTKLEAYLDALKPWPYWRAWVAFATLAGPRWWEQTRVKTGDIHSALGYVRIFARKTGKERNVPIERKVLKPILSEYLEKHRDKVIPEKKDFPWLFPTGFVGHGAKGDGLWRASTWHKFWRGGRNPRSADGTPGKVIVGVRNEAAGKSKDECWEYGPAEWRHCAGTAMGHAGVSGLRISQWLGNSEAICRRHYIADVGAEDWPLSWGNGT